MDFDDEIVIGGISGRFPECNNVDEFKEALLRGDDLLTVDDRRFPAGMQNLPKRSGKIPEIDKFDAAFFGLHPKQANFTDPRHRILLETVYEAIVDAGYNPSELRGSKTDLLLQLNKIWTQVLRNSNITPFKQTNNSELSPPTEPSTSNMTASITDTSEGVFVGLSLFTNFDEITAQDSNGYSILGASLCSAANRISYCFDFTGPSYSLDTGCSSSLYAFTNAVDQLRKGEIKYAIVGGTHIGLSPKESQQYNNLNMLSPDGACKVFSKERNGFARSEAVCAYFLQKKSSSRRIYATVLGSKTNTNGYYEEGYTFPSTNVQLKLMQELYAEAKVSTNDVSYVELHGTGSRVGDPVECQALVNMFCQNRQHPLLIGSVKSNMGHGEPAAGLAAITKVLLAMEYGIIPANIHYDPIDDSIPGLADKKLQIVTKNTKWKGGIVGINGFGFGGANAHVLLKPHVKNKVTPLINRKHRLVHVSGRTEEAVNYFIDEIEKNHSDEEFLGLLDEIHKSTIEGHGFRGYAVLGNHPVKEVVKCKSDIRPIWFVYTGMGAHWPGMGKDLMHIEVFRNTINRCALAVKPYGVDLIDVIMRGSSSSLENLGNCFSVIIAISIALTDLLASMDIKPDFIVGHSLGEVGCAYANGDLTPEQAVLLAYAKYHACKQTKLPLGQMASVGLSKGAIKEILPEDIFIACQNGRDNVTITGPAESTKKFVTELKQKGVFAKLVYTGDIAFHSKYLQDADKYFTEFVNELIPHPKLRSKKWISSSVPVEKIDEKWTKYNCSDYHTNNFRNPVLFDRIFDLVQDNAIVVEIGPHGIMQAILKRELGPNNTLLSVLNRHAEDQEQYLWSSIGKIYNAGGQPNLRKLYKETVFPVSPGTKMIAPLVKWDHTTSWFVPYWKNQDSLGEIVSINLSDEKYSYLRGHIIDGRIVMPASAYLGLVWKLKAKMCLKDITELPIVMENIKFKRATVLREDGTVEFLVNIIKESGYFEIFEGGSLVASGTIRIPQDVSKEFKTTEISNDFDNLPIMERADFYKELHLRKYFYYGLFQGITECDVNALRGKIEWMDNYVSFIDSMCQLSILSENTRCLLVPTGVKKVVLDPKIHTEEAHGKYVAVKRDPYSNVTKSKGIEIYGLKFNQIPLRQMSDQNLLLETFEFVYYDSPENENFNLEKSLIIAIQIIIQNTTGLIKKLTIGDLKENEDSNLELTAQIKNILKNQVLTEAEYLVTHPNLIKETNTKFEVLVADQHVYEQYGLMSFKKYLRENGFFLYIGQIDQTMDFSHFEMVFRTTHLCLLREKLDFPALYDTINIRNTDFKWLDKLKRCVQRTEKKTIFLFSQHEDTTGIIGLQKCLLSERTLMEFVSLASDEKADIFSVDDEFYREQLLKRLAFNVLKNHNWGTFVHLPLEQIPPRYTDNAEIHSQNSGKSNFQFVEKHFFNSANQQNSELVKIHYSVLNIKAVNNNDVYSFGYSGKITDDRSVMGIIAKERICFQAKNDSELTWDVPSSWSLREAATVASDYLICYYALVTKGQMERYESILIHDATMGTGIAAISIALSLQATIFTTVSSVEEKTVLKKLYPLLDESNIVNLSDSSFEHLIQRKTKGKGVDLILNCFTGELLENSLNCLAKGGRFLQIGDNNISNETTLDSSTLKDNCSFHRILLDSLISENSTTKLKLKNLITQGIASEVVKPLPSVVFQPSEIDAAFKLVCSEKYKKKVLLKLCDENKSNISKILVHPKLFFHPDKVYIIIGGLGGIGLELANWLLTKGATKVVLNARRNIWNGYQAFCMRKWSQLKDVVVKVDLNDTTSIAGAETLVTVAQELGPVGGVFNAAIVLQDANIIDQTADKFEEVFKPKIISGINMDKATKRFCSQLDHFVVFSTVFAGRGNIGQTNYGMANSALERLCERRRREHLPGLAVQWGPVEVGFLATTSTEQKNLFNMAPQRISSCLDTLERFLLQKVTVGSSLVLEQEKKAAGATTTRKTLADTIADILGIKKLDSVDKDTNLSRLGLDSLMLAEVKHTLYRHFELDFGPTEIRELTFNNLMNLQIDKNQHKTIVNSENFPPPLLSQIPIVRMKENERNAKIVFVIHPIEGYLHYLEPLASSLRATVYGLQCTKESSFKTIEETAAYFLRFIKEVQNKGPYYFCGYSYGVTLGFEIGLQLEKEGETVQLLAIDGAPDYSRQIFTDGNDLNQKITRLFPSLFKGVNLDKVKAIMENANISEEYISAIFELISQETGIDLEEITYAGSHYLKRCNASFYYQPSQKLKGKLKLVRRLINHLDKSEDYQLQKWCQNTVEVEKLNGDHLTILFGDNLTTLSKIVNEWIEL